MTADKLHVEFESTPAAWCAYYDPESYIGRGNTREDAIIDLMEQEIDGSATREAKLKRALAEAVQERDECRAQAGEVAVMLLQNDHEGSLQWARDVTLDFKETGAPRLCVDKQHLKDELEALRARDAYAVHTTEALKKAKDYLDKHIYNEIDWPSNPAYQDDLDRAYGVIIAAIDKNPAPCEAPALAPPESEDRPRREEAGLCEFGVGNATFTIPADARLVCSSCARRAGWIAKDVRKSGVIAYCQVASHGGEPTAVFPRSNWIEPEVNSQGTKT